MLHDGLDTLANSGQCRLEASTKSTKPTSGEESYDIGSEVGQQTGILSLLQPCAEGLQCRLETSTQTTSSNGSEKSGDIGGEVGEQSGILSLLCLREGRK